MYASVRRLATAGTLSLALALAVPGAALAGPEEQDSGKSTQAQEREHDRGKSSTAPNNDRENDGGKSSTAPNNSSSGSSNASSTGTSSSAAKGDNRSSKASGNNGKRGDNGKRGNDGKRGNNGKNNNGKSDEGRAAGGDPRGNNGTVKIDGEPFDDGRGNDPHVGCVFEIDFYGFDAGDTAAITLTGHAPTGGGLLWSATDQLISSSPARGGELEDGHSIRLTVGEDLSFAGVAPHPQQGWHVKLAVDVDSAPGGAKQKVFWISCPGTAGSGTADSSTDSAGGTTDEATTVAGGTVAPTLGAGTAEVISGTTVAAVQQQEQVLAAQAGRATTRTTLGSGAATAQPGGSRLPSTLPFTGTEGLLALLALGLSAVGVGAVAHRLGRKAAAADVA